MAPAEKWQPDGRRMAVELQRGRLGGGSVVIMEGCVDEVRCLKGTTVVVHMRDINQGVCSCMCIGCSIRLYLKYEGRTQGAPQ